LALSFFSGWQLSTRGVHIEEERGSENLGASAALPAALPVTAAVFRRWKPLIDNDGLPRFTESAIET
jgi:hypothetical protein